MDSTSMRLNQARSRLTKFIQTTAASQTFRRYGLIVAATFAFYLFVKVVGWISSPSSTPAPPQ